MGLMKCLTCHYLPSLIEYFLKSFIYSHVLIIIIFVMLGVGGGGEECFKGNGRGWCVVVEGVGGW